jgi:glycosyltransferase involved in cell wall biosynthesis
MPIIVDCTELHANPVRAGIQRVVREMLRHWPRNEAELRVARFEPAKGLVLLDSPSLALLLEEPAVDDATLRQELRDRAKNAKPLVISDDTLVSIPEVFYDPARARFHQERLRRNPDSLAILAYDFLPWLRPDLFALRTALPLMHYLRLVRDVRHIAFISRQTQREHATRILRRPGHEAGPVLPLGADGLRMERQAWSSRRRNFVALGSIDGRKNQHRIVEAFQMLWEKGADAQLTLLGQVFEGVDRVWLDRIARHPRFRWIEHPDHETVVATLREARATIYVSAAEGFGLPPVESLMIGIPVIATTDIPSVAMLPPGGHLPLPAAEPALIAEAVSALLDDGRAEATWREAASMRLGTWRDFGLAAARWLRSIPPEADHTRAA